MKFYILLFSIFYSSLGYSDEFIFYSDKKMGFIKASCKNRSKKVMDCLLIHHDISQIEKEELLNNQNQFLVAQKKMFINFKVNGIDYQKLLKNKLCSSQLTEDLSNNKFESLLVREKNKLIKKQCHCLDMVSEEDSMDCYFQIATLIAKLENNQCYSETHFYNVKFNLSKDKTKWIGKYEFNDLCKSHLLYFLVYGKNGKSINYKVISGVKNHACSKTKEEWNSYSSRKENPVYKINCNSIYLR